MSNGALGPSDPFAGQPAAALPAGEFAKPHRGVKVLIFGILSFSCFIFGIVAWSMGKGDLAAIDAGSLDPKGRGLTRAGLIVGKIGTFVNVGYLVFMIFYMIMIWTVVQHRGGLKF